MPQSWEETWGHSDVPGIRRSGYRLGCRLWAGMPLYAPLHSGLVGGAPLGKDKSRSSTVYSPGRVPVPQVQGQNY